MSILGILLPAQEVPSALCFGDTPGHLLKVVTLRLLALSRCRTRCWFLWGKLGTCHQLFLLSCEEVVTLTHSPLLLSTAAYIIFYRCWQKENKRRFRLTWQECRDYQLNDEFLVSDESFTHTCPFLYQINSFIMWWWHTGWFFDCCWFCLFVWF